MYKIIPLKMNELRADLKPSPACIACWLIEFGLIVPG